MRFIATAFLLLFSSQTFGMLRQLARVRTAASTQVARRNMFRHLQQKRQISQRNNQEPHKQKQENPNCLPCYLGGVVTGVAGFAGVKVLEAYIFDQVWGDSIQD